MANAPVAFCRSGACERKGFTMNKLKCFARRFMKDESGQGMAEYVLLIVVVVTVAFLFRGKITEMVSNKMGQVSGEFQNFEVQK
jgi:Flp pilus assembly pilin Flp